MSTGKADDRLTARQAADLLGVSPQTVRRWARTGRIRSESITPPLGRAYIVLNKDDVEQVRRERGTHGHGQG